MLNQNNFKANIAGLAEYFNKNLTPELTKIYWRKLNHLEDNDFFQAVGRCIDELKFFPKLPEIIERLPEKPMLQHKGSISCCENTMLLRAKYPPKDHK